jgi:hypothetical protein
MTETQERGPFAGVVDAWHASLDAMGMNNHGELAKAPPCLACGKPLNADGNHPAETYAGTWTGLCYGCTKAPAVIVAVAVLDGLQKVSYPPHCPSWRRDRETFHGYPGCGTCQGMGVGSHGTSVGGSTYRIQCKACADRRDAHPLRALHWRYTELLMRRAQDVYTRALCREAGLPERCAYKRQQAAIAAIPSERRQEIAAPIKARYRKLRDLHDRRMARLRVHEWKAPT